MIKFNKSSNLLGLMSILAVGILGIFQNCANNAPAPAPAAAAQNSTGPAATGANPTGTTPPAAQYVQGQNYGNCTMQLDASFNVVHNGALTSTNQPVTGGAPGSGGASYPILNCPHSGSNNAVTCDTGFKVVTGQLVQMNTGAVGSSTSFTYWVTNSCVKL